MTICRACGQPAACLSPLGPRQLNYEKVAMDEDRTGVDWSRWAVLIAVVQLAIDVAGAWR
ncbi:hypothetical protein ACIGW3_08415 [Streptomyces sp. NPDC053499]|uniref:hypothetical protein n=1 Tax=Streptomyces sp. NPDC053499 TaxID=3365707 RepID=UPI0037CDF6D3